MNLRKMKFRSLQLAKNLFLLYFRLKRMSIDFLKKTPLFFISCFLIKSDNRKPTFLYIISTYLLVYYRKYKNKVGRAAGYPDLRLFSYVFSLIIIISLA